MESLEAEKTALSTAAEQGQKQAVSEAAAAASAEAEQARLTLQAAQEQQAQLQELLKDATSRLEQECEGRKKEQAELER